MPIDSFEHLEREADKEPKKPIQSHDSLSNLKRIALFVFNVFKGIILLFIVAILIRIFIIQPFIVDGPSMEPSFFNGEYLLVDKISPRFSGYHRGDVIVFKYPKNQNLDFIKRIIGLPGETIKITQNKIEIINSQNPKGIFLNEDYLAPSATTMTTKDFSETLGPNEYLVFGDNRDNSLDSRDFGPVDKKLIIGKAWFSFRTFQKIPKVQYNVLAPLLRKMAFQY